MMDERADTKALDLALDLLQHKEIEKKNTLSDMEKPEFFFKHKKINVVAMCFCEKDNHTSSY